MAGRAVREDEVALLESNGMNPSIWKLPPLETKLKIAGEYRKGASARTLADAYGVTVKSILKWIRSVGEPIRTRSQAGLQRIPSKRTYSLDESAFDEINEHSAYWVGFLMADGNVRRRKHGQQVLSIGLGEKDEDHVRKFASFLRTDKPVALRSSQTRKDGNPIIEARFEISSNRIVDALGRYGVVARKSATASVIGLELNRDFWRGVVDGDGHISDAKGRSNLVLCGSKNLTRQFFEFCESIGVEPLSSARYLMKRSLWIVRFHGPRATSVVSSLYRESAVSLDRKRETADRITELGRSW